ncbi:MAG: hypothetical protein WCA77_06605 [Thermoplasmata archaeon]
MKDDTGSSTARWEAELRALREELGAFRSEQREMGRSIEQLTQTFRALAVHLGIASEPYTRKKEEGSRDIPGFA